MSHEISSDGVTVWINADDGWCMGRFGAMGAEIYSHPLASSHTSIKIVAGPPTLMNWREFTEGMKRHYRIDIDDTFIPERLR